MLEVLPPAAPARCCVDGEEPAPVLSHEKNAVADDGRELQRVARAQRPQLAKGRPNVQLAGCVRTGRVVAVHRPRPGLDALHRTLLESRSRGDELRARRAALLTRPCFVVVVGRSRRDQSEDEDRYDNEKDPAHRTAIVDSESAAAAGEPCRDVVPGYVL